MKLERMEDLCEELPTEIIDGLQFRPDFVVTVANLFPKLLAVAKAAKTLADAEDTEGLWAPLWDALAELERE